MLIEESTAGPLRKRFEQDDIENILNDSGDEGLFKYFNNLKKEGFLTNFTFAWGTGKWITFESNSTGGGKIRI